MLIPGRVVAVCVERQLISIVPIEAPVHTVQVFAQYDPLVQFRKQRLEVTVEGRSAIIYDGKNGWIEFLSAVKQLLPQSEVSILQMSRMIVDL